MHNTSGSTGRGHWVLLEIKQAADLHRDTVGVMPPS